MGYSKKSLAEYCPDCVRKKNQDRVLNEFAQDSILREESQGILGRGEECPGKWQVERQRCQS